MDQRIKELERKTPRHVVRKAPSDMVKKAEKEEFRTYSLHENYTSTKYTANVCILFTYLLFY